MKRFIDKIRLYNQQDNIYMYPDESGHFYVHHVDMKDIHGCLRRYSVWDNHEVWDDNNHFVFVPAIIQHSLGRKDEDGNDIYTGSVMVLEISHGREASQHTIWENAKFFEINVKNA